MWFSGEWSFGRHRLLLSKQIKLRYSALMWDASFFYTSFEASVSNITSLLNTSSTLLPSGAVCLKCVLETKAGERQNGKCVPPWPRFLSLRDMHNLSVMFLGQELACSVLKGSSVIRWEALFAFVPLLERWETSVCISWFGSRCCRGTANTRITESAGLRYSFWVIGVYVPDTIGLL